MKERRTGRWIHGKRGQRSEEDRETESRKGGGLIVKRSGTAATFRVNSREILHTHTLVLELVCVTECE